MKIEAKNLRVRYRGGTPGLGALVDLAIDAGDEWGAITIIDCEVHVYADRSVRIDVPLTAVEDDSGELRFGRALTWTTDKAKAEFQRDGLAAVRALAGEDAPWDNSRR